jgi:hypothetical protein
LFACFAALLASGVAINVDACNAELEIVPEPSDWRGWPKLADLGGYRIDGLTMDMRYQNGSPETELRDDGLCPRGGVSLDRWFDFESRPGYRRIKEDVSLSGSGETRVASAVQVDRPSTDTVVEPTFIVAFRRNAGWRLRFESSLARDFAAAFGVGVLGIFAAAALARRTLVAVRSYEETARYKPGVRDASGVVVFDDGSPPLMALHRTNDLVPGPVLVRVTGTTSGGYRVAPSTSGARIVEGDIEALTAGARALAGARLRTTFFGGALFLAGIAAAALYLVFVAFVTGWR